MAWFAEVGYPMDRASQQPAPYLAASVPAQGDDPLGSPRKRLPLAREGFFVWSPRLTGAKPVGRQSRGSNGKPGCGEVGSARGPGQVASHLERDAAVRGQR